MTGYVTVMRLFDRYILTVFGGQPTTLAIKEIFRFLLLAVVLDKIVVY